MVDFWPLRGVFSRVWTVPEGMAGVRGVGPYEGIYAGFSCSRRRSDRGAPSGVIIGSAGSDYARHQREWSVRMGDVAVRGLDGESVVYIIKEYSK